MTDLKELIAKAAEYLDWLTSNAPGPKPEEVKELVRQLYDLAERQPVRDARKVESARVSDDPKYDWRAPSSPEDTTLDDLVTELRKNARFNQEWADGVLGKNESAEYRQTRQMFADQYSGWADAVVALMAGAEPPVVKDSLIAEPVAYLRKSDLQRLHSKLSVGGALLGEINAQPRGDLVAVYADPQPDHVADASKMVEPVAWVTADTVDGQTVNGKPRRIWWENNEGVGMPIYTAPQPSEQQQTSLELPPDDPLGGLEHRADGESNFYTLSRPTGSWVARIQFNGELHAHEQERILNAMLGDRNVRYGDGYHQGYWDARQDSPDVSALVEALEPFALAWTKDVALRDAGGYAAPVTCPDEHYRRAVQALEMYDGCRKMGGEA